MSSSYQEVLDFWFKELNPEQWWKKSPELDNQIRERFLECHQKVRIGETFIWRSNPKGRLAEVLILDQFSRNMFRDTPESFAYDPMALVLAQEIIQQNIYKRLPADMRPFVFMPLMHSESKLVHEEAERLYKQIPDLQPNYAYELKHKAIIDRFGRYPHRNKILGRESTPEEIEFLKGPNSSF